MTDQKQQGAAGDGLNDPQREAVVHGEGPLLILAGAGSGKTRVVVERIALLVRDRGVPAAAILAVTFTNKAAGEMRERVAARLPGQPVPLVSTFHAFCVRVLRQEHLAAGLTSGFSIYDDKDGERAMKEVIRAAGLDDKELPAREVLVGIDALKNRGIWPEDLPRTSAGGYTELAHRLYADYQAKLKASNAVDFGDLLVATARLFATHPAILARYQERYQWLMVDEYQDTNLVQYQLVKQLAGRRQNVCVVGDDDQSIYGWRGASLRNILEFEKDFPGARVVRLEQNYRCTATILAAANAVVANNAGRKGKKLWTENPDGEPIQLIVAPTEREEADFVLDRVRWHVGQGRRLKDIAIFYRTNAQSRGFEEQLLCAGIGYHIVGGLRFYERQEIKDVMAYLRVLVNPADTVAYRRIINVPPRGLGETTVNRVVALAAERQLGFAEALAATVTEQLVAKAPLAKLAAFAALLDELRDAAGLEAPSALIRRVLEVTGYAAKLAAEGTPEAEGRRENLLELITAAKDFEDGVGGGLEDFLAQAALATDVEAGGVADDRLVLMTLHAAKGLEFPVVFMTGMEERLFPHGMCLADTKQLEEERRLCYVGITRARQTLYLTSAEVRRVYGETRYNQQSRFIAEIPAVCLTTTRLAPGPQRYGPVRPGPDSGAAPTWRPGSLVRHRVWGEGKVVKVTGSGPEQKLLVQFKGSGFKQLTARFAGLEPA